MFATYDRHSARKSEPDRRCYGDPALTNAKDKFVMADAINTSEFEVWLPVKGWEGAYEVSSLGRVRSLDREVVTVQKFKGRVLSPQADGKGYKHSVLSNGKSRKNGRIHVLVCEAFHGPRPTDDHVVAHNDGDKTNNVPGNLRWATISENAADALKHGSLPIGVRHHFAKLTEQQVREIRADERGPTEVGLANGISKGVVHAIRTRKTWKHVA